MEKMFKTQTSSLDQLSSNRFMIPSYQRPFVWGEEQINKLLSDFFDAYARNDTHYFIGTVLISTKGDINELIDGQQRFTTLWLISVSFKILGIKSKILEYLKTGDDLRFDFAIRKQLKTYLLSLLEKTKNEKNQYSDSEVENDEYLINVAKAVTTIAKKIETLSFSGTKTIEGFGDYIFEKVQFVMNTAPNNTNLNKLFSTINNSGVQLEQSDILKSKLLRLISKGTGFNAERVLYSKIWEACENMENYFEKNVRKLFPKTSWLSIDKETFKEFDDNIFKYRDEQETEEGDLKINRISLNEILQKETLYQKNEIVKLLQDTVGDDDEAEKIYCRSVINFSQLLLHSFRIYLAQNDRPDFELPFHIKHLLDVFKSLENESQDFIKGFFLCLWKVRYVFDKNVVKWVQKSEDKDEELTITTVSQSIKRLSKDRTDNKYFSRSQPETKDAGTMLQSVLYFTGNYNTQIWLSPYLKRLLENEDSEKCLESIDNLLSLSLEEDKPTTFNLMNPGYSLSEKLDFELYLNEPHGTSFKHYWFQKLEYILWKEFENKNDIKYKEFRITSKNSVEHVFPQNEEFGLKLEILLQNSFGNLGLLSVSQNSSYSNQAVEKKLVDFNKKDTYDSLKLFYLYNNFIGIQNIPETTIEEKRMKNIAISNLIKNHQSLIVNSLKAHYSK